MAPKKSLISLISLLLAGGLYSSLATGINTIRPGDKLDISNHLVSTNGLFTLGFFDLEYSNNSYFGIWYTNLTGIRVWVANRDTPIFNNSGILTIDTTGKLLIQSKGGDPILLNSDQGSGNVTATLQDTGNFVVADETEKRVLWQSFDYPTDMLLPGMKLGVNLKTGRNWTLASSLSSFVPASGAFTLSWEPTQDSGELVIRRRGLVYWTSGVLTNQGLPFMPQLSSYFNFKYVSNQEEKYLTLSAYNFVPDSTMSRRLVLNSDGQIVDGDSGLLNGVLDFCNGYKSADSGCASARRVPKCRGRKEEFEKRSGSFVGSSVEDNAQPTDDDNSSLGLSDCWAKCWSDCNCVGFGTLNGNGTGCQIWSGNYKFQQDLSGAMLAQYVIVNPPKGKKWIWIIIAISIPLIVIMWSFLCYLRKRKLKLKGEEKRRQEAMLHELTTSDRLDNAIEVENHGKAGHDLKIFSFACIMAATNNFSPKNKLGQGGFGPVYKGELLEGRKIAVKRLSSTSRQGLVEFKNELILIAKLQHMNLVRVLGCCIHEKEKMLIYEYMSNKSLDFYLFDLTKRKLLDWRKRFNIIEGVAQGVLYLHRYSRLRIIHRDLKASNILLDDNMNPKISDFGLARIFGQNETEANTRRPVGTYGYMSPEYAMEGTFSMKSDVFSFGVLLLEIVSGKKNTSFHHRDRPLNLIGYAWELWKEGTALELMDPSLGDSCPTNQLLRIIHLGLLCVQENAMDRPTMSDVIFLLRNETMPLLVPKQPAFFTGRSMMEVNSPGGKSKDCSVNGLSISTMDAR